MKKRVLRAAFAATMVLSVGLPMEASAQVKPMQEPVAQSTMKAKKEPTARQLAARERMKKCSTEWKSAKASGKMEAGMKWPKFWSACNTRLKGDNKA